jgi:tetratricopeptide (TPR) repeat protein
MSWSFVLPQFLVIILLIVAIDVIVRPPYLFHSILWGCAIYLLYSFSSRFLLTRAHRRGRQLANRGQYQQAIAAFEKSYQFFSRYDWIDRYRYLTLMTPSAMSYWEMALINIGYCYLQLGKKQKAREYFQRALAQFPQSQLAKHNLRIVEASEK